MDARLRPRLGAAKAACGRLEPRAPGACLSGGRGAIVGQSLPSESNLNLLVMKMYKHTTMQINIIVPSTRSSRNEGLVTGAGARPHRRGSNVSHVPRAAHLHVYDTLVHSSVSSPASMFDGCGLHLHVIWVSVFLFCLAGDRPTCRPRVDPPLPSSAAYDVRSTQHTHAPHLVFSASASASTAYTLRHDHAPRAHRHAPRHSPPRSRAAPPHATSFGFGLTFSRNKTKTERERRLQPALLRPARSHPR